MSRQPIRNFKLPVIVSKKATTFEYCLYCWIACDVMAAMLVVKNKSLSLRWELNFSFYANSAKQNCIVLTTNMAALSREWNQAIVRTDRFHMVSRQPCWCTKTKERRPYWCTRLELYFYANTFFCERTNIASGHVSENDLYSIGSNYLRLSKFQTTKSWFIWSNVI